MVGAFHMDSGFSLQIPRCSLSYTGYVVVLLPDFPERLVSAPKSRQRECVLTIQCLQYNDTTLTLDETSRRNLLECYPVQGLTGCKYALVGLHTL